ncbi:WD40 repeat-like protein [Aspergillus homomorphus CBS 101889]|uniref:WD40 repeat-like protein n=1 Tax=Aspergillus homomorphus (strain CBS 101889) TaxID=1450537 RepID=A0A395HK45_ASPHC|nr:WD40 repeat-like protein [Aspergillus homomorphus CBS 101889]RAL07575.1 WD40 repeat-like protein [Aspergillus homomorphus CBS 101889]
MFLRRICILLRDVYETTNFRPTKGEMLVEGKPAAASIPTRLGPEIRTTTSTANKSIFLRSIDNPSIARQYTEHKAQTTVARFSPSGFYVASGDATGIVRVWDCAGEGITKGEYSIVNGRINDLAWDGDSQRIIAVGDGKQRYGHCITWDSGNTVGEIYGHTQQINSVSIRQQRPLRAAAAGDDKNLVFYHGAPFKFNTGIRDKHINYIYGVGFSPDGSTLVSVGADRKIWLYDGKTGEPRGQIGEREHKGSIFAVSWAKDSRKFVTASADRTVKIWDVEAGKVTQSWDIGEEGVSNVRDQQVGVVWPPARTDSLLISLSLSGDLNYLVEGTPKPRQVIQGHQKNITSLTQFRSGSDAETLWSGSFDGRVCHWDVPTGTSEEMEGDGHTAYIAGLAPTHEGTGRIYSVAWDDTIRSVDLGAKTYTGISTKLSGQPKGIAAAKDKVVVGTTESVEVYHDALKTGEFKPQFAVTTVAAHGNLAALGGEDSSVQIFDVSADGLTPKTDFKASRHPISALAFSPDGSLLAVGDSRGRVLVYQAANGNLVTDRWTAHTSRVTSIAWNEDNTHVVSGGLDTNIFVWSLTKPGDWLQVSNAHKEGVNGVAWIAGGSKIASAGADAAIKLRYATFVLPRTGQRLKGLINLRNPDWGLDGSSNDDERRALLTGEIPAPRKGLSAHLWGKFQSIGPQAHDFFSSELGIGVLKCSLAYLLGSLATFVPAISSFLGHQDGKHMVATVTVYFHPARSQGSMYKALICAFAAFLYAALISVTSMFVSMFFQDTLHMFLLGHAVVLVVFCGGGLGFIGWTKQRLGDPLVNVACSLASLSTITVLTKEGAVQSGDLSFAKISQVLKMVVMGVTASMAVSFLIFPISARKQLRSNLTTVTETLATMLALITESFLSGSEEELQTAEFLTTAARHKKAYGQLDRLVREAKMEHFVVGTEKEYRLEKTLVRWVQDITHNMGGLRSAAHLQFQLLKQTKAAEAAHQGTDPGFGLGSGPLPSPWSLHEDRPLLEPIYERPEEELLEAAGADGFNFYAENGTGRGAEQVLYPADIFAVFISHLGPSMRSLAFTLKEIFRDIPFKPESDYRVSINSRYRSSLDRALELYRNSREEALKTIYRQREVLGIQTLEVEADLEEVSASCGHFSFSLLEFGEQLKELLAILDELQLVSEERPDGRSWNWLKFWRWTFKGTVTGHELDATMGQADIGEHHVPDPPSSSSVSSDVTAISLAKQRLGYRLWRSLGMFRRDDTKFAIKVGTGAALYALPAFIPSTRPVYGQWRGEWGLLSYMLVCSMTIGASNTTGYARFLGTCMGAGCAILSWYVTGGNVYGLACVGLLMACWNFYIIIVRGQGPMGRFIMLTYNLSVLYAYSLAQKEGRNDQDEGGDSPVITEIALHRVVAVLSGCLWGIIITRMIWPISARERLKDGLSLLWLRMSLIWKRGPLSTLANPKESAGFMSAREKLEVERFLSHLESLQASARSEFELKSAFPDASYGNILRRTRSMVDAFVAINLELVKNMTASEGELSILRYTVKERQQLSYRISHLLTVMASSMKLEYPLSDALPNVEHARDRLLARLFHYRKDPEASRLSTDEDYALLYAYDLVLVIDPAALSRSDSASAAITPSKGSAPSASALQKSTKPLNAVPRLDLEPVYTELKAAIGDHWSEYKEATALFLLGQLNQSELSSRVDHIICADQKTEHLHNHFVCAIIGNLTRDLPDHGVASWVSANDKPSVVSKPNSGDAAEQRLKTEVMQLPARDRRRLKAIPERDHNEISSNDLAVYHLAKQIKLPSQVPASAGGLNKTNWELEIRKRYAQPLASETGEFPDAESIHARMVPICYEESIVSGASLPCAEYMAIATETFVKEVLSVVFSRTRSNGPSGTINGMMMRKYRQQLEREELAFTRGEIVKDSATGLLPIEAKEAGARKPLGVRDLRLALELGSGVLSHMPLLVDQIMGGYLEDELEAEKHDRNDDVEITNDDAGKNLFSDEMEIDDLDSDWEGGTTADREHLGALLDECLSMAA